MASASHQHSEQHSEKEHEKHSLDHQVQHPGGAEDSSDSDGEHEGRAKIKRKVSTSGQIRCKVRLFFLSPRDVRPGLGSAGYPPALPERSLAPFSGFFVVRCAVPQPSPPLTHHHHHFYH